MHLEFTPTLTAEQPLLGYSMPYVGYIATLHPFGRIEGQKWFDQIPANESPKRAGLHSSLSAKSNFTSLYLKSPVYVVPPQLTVQQSTIKPLPAPSPQVKLNRMPIRIGPLDFLATLWWPHRQLALFACEREHALSCSIPEDIQGRFNRIRFILYSYFKGTVSQETRTFIICRMVLHILPVLQLV